LFKSKQLRLIAYQWSLMSVLHEQSALHFNMKQFELPTERHTSWQ